MSILIFTAVSIISSFRNLFLMQTRERERERERSRSRTRGRKMRTKLDSHVKISIDISNMIAKSAKGSEYFR
jgi:hypothetical protein